MGNITEVGQVVKIHDDLVTVKYNRQSACKNCQACMAGAKENEMFLTAQNDCHAEIGDFVNVTLPEKQFIKAVSLLYGVPLVTMLLGFFIAYQIPFIYESANKELYSFIVGIVAMVVTYFIIHLRDKRKTHELPRVTRVVNSP